MKDLTRLSRREALKQGGSALALLAFFDSPLFAWGREGERTIPFLDQPAEPPLPGLNLLDWQSLDSWVTPNERFLALSHFGTPEVSAAGWKLEVAGLLERPRRYTLAELKALPRKEVVFTLECSGNGGFPWFQGGLGNARWGGASLASVLEQGGVKDGGIEVVFYGADAGDATVPYIGGLGDKMGEFKAPMSFARSMTLPEAMDPANLLCYEMNGEALPRANGHPLRLIAPRWYGIANVKWLTRIEVRDHRFLGPFVAERYVTVREEPRADGGSAWVRTAVGKSLLKSMTAKVTVKDGLHRIYGAAWGAPIARVEVRVDEGPWTAATFDRGQEHEFAWKFWHLDWKTATPGDHRVTSRAIDTAGNVQPAPDDWRIAKKHTYWEANQQVARTIRI
jgi:DMSO/TMAO reductase YedYZ molybdopterin-dependent catalytic subunit